MEIIISNETRTKPAASGKSAGGAGRRSTGTRSGSGAKNTTQRRPSDGTRARQQQPQRRSTAASRANPPRKGNRRKRKRGPSPFLVFFIIILALVIVGFAAIGAYAMQFMNYDKIMPNVYVAGVDVGGMTVEEATAAIESSVQETEQQSINVYLPDQVLTFTPAQDTVLIDVDQAVEEAYRYGRNSTNPFAISRAINAAKSRRNDIDISTAITVDTSYIRTLIDEKAAEITSDMVESEVNVDDTTRTITVSIGHPGYGLDTATLYTLVCNGFASGDYSDISFDYDMSYPATIVLDRLYEQLSCEPTDAYYDPETGTVQPETVGYTPTIDIETANQELAMAQPGDTLSFGFLPVEAEVHAAELEAVLFRDTLYSYGTTYANNAGRTTNLRLACEAINGTVIQPGEVFSFNDTVGERTAEKGYQEAVVYVNGNSDPALGGGICQVASTIYYCCLYSDLEIVQREEHMYYVTYVPGGMDATVYWGSVDFKFRNSTDYPLRIDAELSNGKVNIALVGTDVNNYTVKIDSKEVSKTPYETIRESGTGENISGYTGYVYTITRRIYDKNGNLVREDSTAALDDMGGGCGTSTYEKRDEVIYTGKTSGSRSGSGSGSGSTTPSPSPSPSTEPSSEPSATPIEIPEATDITVEAQ